jgi:hypothetical protein
VNNPVDGIDWRAAYRWVRCVPLALDHTEKAAVAAAAFTLRT